MGWRALAERHVIAGLWARLCGGAGSPPRIQCRHLTGPSRHGTGGSCGFSRPVYGSFPRRRRGVAPSSKDGPGTDHHGALWICGQGAEHIWGLSVPQPPLGFPSPCGLDIAVSPVQKRGNAVLLFLLPSTLGVECSILDIGSAKRTGSPTIPGGWERGTWADCLAVALLGENDEGTRIVTVHAIDGHVPLKAHGALAWSHCPPTAWTVT